MNDKVKVWISACGHIEVLYYGRDGWVANDWEGPCFSCSRSNHVSYPQVAIRLAWDKGAS